MSSPGQRADPRSLEDVIESELKALRQRSGISHGRVKREAPAIASLPAVDAELAAHPTYSRSVAAYNVIRCAILYHIQRPDLRRVLVRSLNVDGNGPASLTERRETVMAELGRANRNNFEKLETEAYRELVATLLTLEESPCTRPGGSLLKDIAALAEASLNQYRGQSIDIQIPAAALIEVMLGWLANDDGKPSVTAITSGLQRYFRTMRKLSKTERRRGSRVRFRVLLEQATLQATFPPYVLSRRAILSLLNPSTTAQSELDIVVAEHPEHILLGPNGEAWIALEYYERKARSIRLLTQLLIAYDTPSSPSPGVAYETPATADDIDM